MLHMIYARMSSAITRKSYFLASLTRGGELEHSWALDCPIRVVCFTPR